MNGVSIIICCYNSSKRIVPALQHLQKQMFNRVTAWEVIVVDNASTDNTTEIANKTWNEYPIVEFKVVPEEKPGLMHARHKGLENASYEIVSFIDDDNWVEERWVEKVYEVFSINDRIGACGGRSEAVFEKSQPEWFPLFQSSFAVGKQGEESGIVDNKKGFLWGAGFSFRKSLWLELQRRGFKNLTVGRQGKNITAGEDTELCYAFRLLGYHLYYDKDLTLKHYMPAIRMNFAYLARMNEGFGKANVLLNCYRVLLYKDTFQLRQWWYEWLVARKSIFVEFVKSILASSKNEIWLARSKKSYWKGYASQTWKEKSFLLKRISSIKEILNSV